jgi:hypothetical protein
MADYQSHIVKARPAFTWVTDPRRVSVAFHHLGVHYYAHATWKRADQWEWRVGLDIAPTRFLSRKAGPGQAPRPDHLMDWAFDEVK